MIALWNRIFWDPVSPAAVGLYRAMIGVILLANWAMLFPDLDLWFTGTGVLSVPSGDSAGGQSPLALFRYVPDSSGAVHFVWATGVVAALGVMLGAFTRASLVLAFLTLFAFHQRSPLIFNAGDTLLRIQLLLLICSRAGDAFSIDRLRRRRRGTPPSAHSREPWAQRLIQLQLALVYALTWLAKTKGSTWSEGTALYYATRLVEFQRFRVPLLFDHLWIMKLMTWGTLAFECAFPLLVWWRRTRYPMLAAALLFHLGIEYSMDTIFFQWVMIATLVLFVPPHDLMRGLAKVRRLFRRAGEAAARFASRKPIPSD